MFLHQEFTESTGPVLRSDFDSRLFNHRFLALVFRFDVGLLWTDVDKQQRT